MSVMHPSVERRIEICQYASYAGLDAARSKFGLSADTIRKWRCELGFPRLKCGPKHTPLPTTNIGQSGQDLKEFPQMSKNPTERMIEQFGRVKPTPEQSEKVEIVRAKYVELAYALQAIVPGSAEFTVALRKLLESKDAAVRSIIFPQ